MKIVYLFGKFGDFSKKPYGGGEVGNRRTKRFWKTWNIKLFQFIDIVIIKRKVF